MAMTKAFLAVRASIALVACIILASVAVDADANDDVGELVHRRNKPDYTRPKPHHPSATNTTNTPKPDHTRPGPGHHKTETPEDTFDCSDTSHSICPVPNSSLFCMVGGVNSTEGAVCCEVGPDAWNWRCPVQVAQKGSSLCWRCPPRDADEPPHEPPPGTADDGDFVAGGSGDEPPPDGDFVAGGSGQLRGAVLAAPTGISDKAELPSQ
eukprot:CAMPEP_0172577224 /NCGR_PEP_ID=MMETSP1067-20121228/138124_1 /TAXON_ID=265564 ORGANISM="Thalassiosira punctigera, Strain Tpunct2005C2" /NCGR_SAMPLE_ID=MMETSP1067 /ASSEMBLY_ACC=CAM_ASM_000444 /LENGTH=209 /DNA_ID=CAMNT_0013369909 /DNA_START=37 /DNA_END=666 /DNA_ORIENTATION=+